MVNKIFPGEKAIRIGKSKIWLCEIEGCKEPIMPRGRKYCLKHSIQKSGFSGRIRDSLGKLNGEAFRMAFDGTFGILYCDLKIISGACEWR